MLCVFVCAPVHVYGQSDRCCVLVGAIDYWKKAIAKWGRLSMPGSITEVQSHDEGIRVEEVQQEFTGL